ncbi:MAG TPA: ABC transporter ATP-binding protein [Fimbriimonadaceae bacterium]|nr:ABC transporter ATP-binding protein [Fimbriimonadaceae bacterium]
MNSASVVVSGLSCGYGAGPVIHDIDLSVGAGEVVALIGPNGSGKSTLMKAIAGALRPIKGSVTLDGQDLSTLNQKEIARRLAYVPQIESPAFDFTVQEVVLMGRIPHTDGMFETQNDYECAEKAMQRADCYSLRERRMSELSGGEAQRAKVARALAQEAGVMLMDEPTTHLDVKHQMEIGDIAKGLAEEGYAVVVAVHELNWAAMYASRVVVLVEGRVALSGETEQTLESPVLDRAFEVEFVRTRDAGLRLFPK